MNLPESGTPYDAILISEGDQQIRLRAKHSKTIKDGWSLNETTVEVTVPSFDAAAAINWADLYRSVHAAGCEEAYRRNTEEAA